MHFKAVINVGTTNHEARFSFKMCDMRNLQGDYHTLGFNQQKSKLSSVKTQNSYVRRHQQQHFTVMIAFKFRSDIHTPTAPSCRGSNQRFTIEKSREATTHKFPQNDVRYNFVLSKMGSEQNNKNKSLSRADLAGMFHI